MSIAFVAGSTGDSVGSSMSLSLPTGFNTAGNVTLAFFTSTAGYEYYSNALVTITAPSGWTPLFNLGGFLVCWRAWQGGDPSSITATSSGSSFYSSAALTYSGCDGSAPIDTWLPFMAFQGSVNFPTVQLNRAPSVSPNYNGSTLVCAYLNNYYGANAYTLPGGLTSRHNDGGGPNIAAGDLALSGGAPTGDYIATNATADGSGRLGIQIALKASGAAAATLAPAQPELVAATSFLITGSGAQTVDLTRLGVQNGDMIAMFFSGTPNTITAASGYTAQLATQGAQTYTHTWLTGDSTSPSFSFSAGGFIAATVAVARKVGVSASAITVDALGSASATASGTITATAPSIAPTTAQDLLLVFMGSADATNTGAWSAITSGPTIDVEVAGSGAGCDALLMDKVPAANPSGMFSATDTKSGSHAVVALSLLLRIGSAGGAGQRPVVQVCG